MFDNLNSKYLFLYNMKYLEEMMTLGRIWQLESIHRKKGDQDLEFGRTFIFSVMRSNQYANI